MSYWEKNPLSFQIILIVLGFLLLGMSFFNFYRNISSPTDENLFSNLNNRYYLTKGIPVKSKIKVDSVYKETTELIPVGSILININKTSIRNDSSLIISLINSTDSLYLNVAFEQLNQNKPKVYKIHKDDFDINKLRYIKSAVYIIDVKKGGSSERAGLMVGDIILKINNKSFADAMQADMLMKKNISGNIAKYLILRNNKEIEIDVQLAKFGIEFIFLSLFLNGIILFLLGWYIGLMRPNLISARLISLTFLLLGFVVSTYFDVYQLEYDIFSYFRAIAISIAILFGLPLLFHSFYYFPKEIPEIINKQWIFKIPYLISAFSFSTLLIMMVFFTQYYTLIAIINIISIGIIITYFQIIRFRYFKKIKKEDRRLSYSIRYAAGLFIILFFILPLFNIPYLSSNLQYISVLIILFPLSYIYTIGRYRLLDLDFRVNKNIQYTTIQIIWNLLIFIMLGYTVYIISINDVVFPNIHFNGSAIEVLDHPLPDSKQEMYQRIFAIILSVFALVLFYFLRNFGINFLRQLYDRTGFDYKTATSTISDTFYNNYSDSELCTNIVKNLSNVLKIKSVAVIFFQTDEIIWEQEYFNLPVDELKEFHSQHTKRLFFSVGQFNGAISIDYLPEQIKNTYIQYNVKYVIPIRSKGKLVGLFLIGEKLSETSFNSEELSLLNSIAIQTAITIENSFLYQELSKRERMKHELELARKIQLATLPQHTPEINNLDIASDAIPAYEVGGDFYDYLIDSNNDLTIVVGDVSGKGTSAALIMSKAQGIMRALHSFDLTPKELLIKTNDLLQFTLNKGNFITVLATKFSINSNSLTIARAGHLPLYYYNSRKKKVYKLLPKGIVIGVSKIDLFSKLIEEEVINYNSNDIFILLTDGISESRNSEGDDYGENCIIKILENSNHKSALEIKDLILNSVRIFSSQTSQFDDMTVVVVKVK